MQLLAGTSGFAYKEWKGPFYPEDLPERRMLGFYAERLPTVEINHTFYRMPKASVLAGWAGQVPPAFRFAIKASRRITHVKRLKDAGEETGYLLGAVQALGERLGALLFQLPPYLRCDAGRLEAFLELLPEGTPAAFEFRHPSWRDERVWAALRARDFAWVGVDDAEGGSGAIESTSRWGYLRLRRAGYERAELAAWVARAAAAGWERTFVYLKHEDAGAGPRLAAELLDVAGRATSRSARRVGSGSRRPPPQRSTSATALARSKWCPTLT